MFDLAQRRHIRHYEVPGGDCHVTWRIARGRPTLEPAERDRVLEVLRKATEYGCLFHAAVIMDDHVHVLFRPGPRRTSTQFVQAWKSTSSHILCQQHHRNAPVWQRDFYQRWIRHPGQLDICAAYINANPQRRWPGVVDYPWVLP